MVLKSLKAWMPLLKLGNTVSRRNELEKYSRYLVLSNIKEARILDFLEKPKTIYELVQEFNWEYPSKYVDDFLRTLINDRVILKHKGKYIKLEADGIEKPDVKFIEDFNEVFAVYATAIPERLQGKYFEYTGRLALFSWDSVLAGTIYQALRDSAWNFINPKILRNCKMLDIGCGPGYETADFWVRLQDSNTEITALDYDEDLLRIAKEEFCKNITQFGLEKTTWDRIKSPPTFVLGSADKMNMFDDNSFDVIYFSNFLHWLNNPLDGIEEMYRVLKPGGFIFGSQGTSEITNPYLDITARVVEGTYGYFPKVKFKEWFKQAGFTKLKSATMVNTFKAKKAK